jgi:tetratricopeptide (TPR) repeat protein
MQISNHREFKFDGLVQKKDILKQAFNAVYFFGSAIVVTLVAQVYNLPAIWVIAAVFSVLAFGACIKLYKGELHSADLDIRLTRRVQNFLRTSALVIPIPFFALYVASTVAQAQCLEGEVLLKQGKYREALSHLNQAVYLNPRMKKAFETLADVHNFTHEFDKTILDADNALSLDPADSSAYASKSWALNSMHKREEALTAALTAVKLNPADGQAQHALAQVYYNLGQYERALPAAEQHIQFHRFEAEAFSQRADILEKLGQHEEASQDRYTADDLRWIRSFKPTKVEQPQSI